MANPIKYSDLIVPDNAVTDLIAQLNELAATLKTMMAEVKSEAASLRTALQNVNSATKEGADETEKQTKKADELAAAYNRLQKAQADNAAEIARVNQLAKEQNQQAALTARYLTAEEGSYNQLAASLARVKMMYQQLSAEERKGSEGEVMRKRIAELSGELKAYNLELQENVKLQELKAKRDASAVGSYNRLAAVYNILKLRLNAMGEATDKDAASKRKMEEAAKAVYQQMIKLQEAAGKHTLSVGNYAKSWDGLRFSVFQVMREIPNAAMNLNTFFLAISNNLPIVADEIARVTEENKKLAAEGKPTTSVIKQIASAVFSWQTLMVTGIFLLTKYGAQIAEWAKSLFTGAKAAMTFKEAVSAITEEIEKSGSEYGKNMAAYRKLQASWKDTSGLKERQKWLEKHRSEYEQLTSKINDVNDADNFFVNNTAAVVQAFKKRAMAAAAMNLATKEWEKAFQLQVETLNKTGTSQDNNLFLNIALGLNPNGGNTADAIAAANVKTAGQNYRTALRNAEQFFNLAQTWGGESDDVLGEQGRGGRNRRGRKGGNGRDPRNMTKDIEDIIRQVKQALSESETALMGEGINQTISSIDDKVKKAINGMERIRGRITHWLADPKRFKLTKEQRESLMGLYGLIDATIGNMRTKGGIDSDNARTSEFAKDMSFEARMRRLAGEGTAGMSIGGNYDVQVSILKAQQDAELATLNDTYKLRADLIEKGDADELKRLAQFNREWELLTKKHALQSAQLSAELINDYFSHDQALAELASQTFYTNARMNGGVGLSRRQALALNYNEATAKRGRDIAAQRQILQNELSSPEQKQIAQARIDLLNSQQEAADLQYKKDGRPKNIYELMGLELNSEDMAAIDAGKQYAMDAMNSLMQLEQAWADKAVENAQRRVEATKNALQIEKEARANGYANNVEYAQKEYEAAKKQEEKALRQRKRIQKAQLALETASQVSNLVTASAGIWKTFAEMSQPWLAPAMIGVMWASFAASKIMAAKMVDAQNADEEYAEGHVELLHGGSHASGNDIDLGVKPDGTRRRAEGGEYFIVINKRNSRKYRRQIPDIINSLNSGTFDSKYMSADDAGKYITAYDRAGNITIKSDRSRTDLSRLESDVRRLREQGERRTFVDAQGNIVEEYKNVRRITRK